MKKSEKIELTLIIGFIILLFLTSKEVFSTVPFLIATICMALYFSPIKLIRIINLGEDKKFRIAVNSLLTVMIILSYVSIKIEVNNTLHIMLLAVSIANLVLLFLWNKKRKTSDFYLLVLNLFLVSGASFI